MNAHKKLEAIADEIDRQFAPWGLKVTGGDAQKDGIDLTATYTDPEITAQQKLVTTVLKKYNVKQIELRLVSA